MTQFPALSQDIYAGQSDDAILAGIQVPDMSGLDPNQMSNMVPPPSINVEFAPPSRVPSFGPGNENDFDALSPPSSKFTLFSYGFTSLTCARRITWTK